MTGQTMLITGGSRGIGRATALMAARDGWRVAFSYHSDEAAAQDTARSIDAAGGQALAVRADVAREPDTLALFDRAEDSFGRIDAVVANAGIVGPKSTLADMTLDRMQRLVDTNVTGALLTAREAARRLPRSEGEPWASLVFVSSVAARIGAPGEYVDYAATKGAVDSMTLGLSKELAPSRIRVNAVRPGPIETDIHASGGQPDRIARIAPSIPMGRAGTPDEIAAAILWLCSEGAAYTSGALLDVAGGR